MIFNFPHFIRLDTPRIDPNATKEIETPQNEDQFLNNLKTPEQILEGFVNLNSAIGNDAPPQKPKKSDLLRGLSNIFQKIGKVINNLFDGKNNNNHQRRSSDTDSTMAYATAECPVKGALQANLIIGLQGNKSGDKIGDRLVIDENYQSLKVKREKEAKQEQIKNALEELETSVSKQGEQLHSEKAKIEGRKQLALQRLEQNRYDNNQVEMPGYQSKLDDIENLYQPPAIEIDKIIAHIAYNYKINAQDLKKAYMDKIQS